MVAALAVLAFTWLQEPPESAQRIEGRMSRVVDGDSLHMTTHAPQIRLWGVDAPERDELGFQAAMNELQRITEGQGLACDPVDRVPLRANRGAVLPSGRAGGQPNDDRERHRHRVHAILPRVLFCQAIEMI